MEVTYLLRLHASDLKVQTALQGYPICIPSQLELHDLNAAGGLPAELAGYATRRTEDCIVVAAMSGASIVSFVWLQTHSVTAAQNFSRTARLGTPLEFAAESAFLFDAFTVPAHRGKRLLSALITYIVTNQILSAHTLFATIDCTNRASLSAFSSCGFQSQGTIIRGGLGPCQITRFPAKNLGSSVRVGKPIQGIVANW